ncbi:MAG: hypothetical protein AAFV25_19820, partial [Bacteroidota bacterium]
MAERSDPKVYSAIVLVHSYWYSIEFSLAIASLSGFFNSFVIEKTRPPLHMNPVAHFIPRLFGDVIIVS